MESWSIEPEELALGGQRLSQGEKGVKHSKSNHGQSECLTSIFFSDALRCDEQDYAIGDVLKYFIFRDVSVGRGAQANLREEQHEKEQGGRVQRVFRQLHLPGKHLPSRPNQE